MSRFRKFPFLFSFIAIFFAFSASADTLSATPGTAASAADAGTSCTNATATDWSNLTTAFSADDTTLSVYGTGNFFDASEISEELQLSNFGFAIPTGATINGITAVVRQDVSSANDVFDYDVRLTTTAGVQMGQQKSRGLSAAWSTTEQNITYGSSLDLWNATSTLTADAINDPGFGITICVQTDSGGSNETASIDLVQITVDYIAPIQVQEMLELSGMLYDGEGINVDTSGGDVIKLAIATSSSATVYSTTTQVSGFWGFRFAIDGFANATGAPMVAWLDGQASKAVSVNKASSTVVGANISNYDLYKNFVISRHEGHNGTSTTIGDFAKYDADNDSDIPYRANAGILDVNASNTLYIWPGTEFSPGGAVILHGNRQNSNDGDIKLPRGIGVSGVATSSILTMDTNSLTLAGSWYASSSSIFTSLATTTFNATTTGKNIIATSTPFHNLAFNGGGGSWNFNSYSATTSGNFHNANGTTSAPGSELTVLGNYFNGSKFLHNNGKLIFASSSGQSLSGLMVASSSLGNIEFRNSGAKTFSSAASSTNFVVASNSGSVVFPADLSLSGNFTNDSVISANSGTVYIASTTAAQTLSGNMTQDSAFYNLVVLNNSGTNADTDPGVIFSGAASTTNNFSVSTASSTIRFLAGATSTFQNLIVLGGGVNSRVYFRSTNPGSTWGIIVPGTRSISYLNVMDSYSCAGFDDIDAGDGTNVNSGNNFCWNFDPNTSATIILANDIVFIVNQVTGVTERITITAGAVTGAVTASSDLRIAISTTTLPILWDTSDTTATFGGTASGKVSNPVSYEGGGSVLVIPVDTDFELGETLTIDDVSFSGITSAGRQSYSGLKLFLNGSQDQSANAEATSQYIAVRGTLTISGNNGGAEANKFNISSSNLSDAELYSWKMTANGEAASTTYALVLTNIDGIESSDISDAVIYVDLNDNGNIDAGDYIVHDIPVVSINDTIGSISFSPPFGTTTKNYIFRATLANLGKGDGLDISITSASALSTGGVSLVSIPVLGTVSTIIHNKPSNRGGGSGVGVAAPNANSSGGGQGRDGGDPVGTTPPPPAPPTTGGTDAGGGSGAVD